MSSLNSNERNGKEYNQDKPLPMAQVVIPESPELMMRLAEKILSVHESKGAASPVSDALAVQIGVKCSLAKEKHEEGMANLKNGSKALETRDAYLGIKQPPGGRVEVSLKFYLQCAAEIIGKKDNGNLLKEFGLKG